MHLLSSFAWFLPLPCAVHAILDGLLYASTSPPFDDSVTTILCGPRWGVRFSREPVDQDVFSAALRGLAIPSVTLKIPHAPPGTLQLPGPLVGILLVHAKPIC